MMIGQAWAHRKEPIVADKRLDWACGSLWMIYGLWGILTPIVDQNQVLETTWRFYPLIWGLCIGVCGLSSAAAVLATLTTPGDKVTRRVRFKQWEMFSVTAMGVLIGFFPVIQFFRLAEGSWDRLDTFVLSFAYLIMPGWRIGHLFERIRILRQIRVVDK